MRIRVPPFFACTASANELPHALRHSVEALTPNRFASAEQLPITAIQAILVGHYDPHALDALRDRAIVEGELLGAARCELRGIPGGVAVRGRLGDVRTSHAGFHGSTVAA